MLWSRTPEWQMFLSHASVPLSSRLSFTSVQVMIHIGLEQIFLIWAGFICYQLCDNCFCLTVISEQERNQNSNEGNQTATNPTNLQASSSWIKWAMYIHKQHEEINIKEPISSKGALNEEDGSVWIIKFNCHEVRRRNTLTECVCAYLFVLV